MQQAINRSSLIQQLQKEILSLQGMAVAPDLTPVVTGLDFIRQSFPNKTFPTGAVHEFISQTTNAAAATSGFLTGLLQSFIRSEGLCVWVSTRRAIYPPALKAFGIEPERVVFIDATKEKEALWAIEEALKCDAVATVIGEIKEISLTASRRLQLAVEQSRVTGLIHRYQPLSSNTTAFVSRWQITPLATLLDNELPGVGQPRWNVQLLRVRNGKPGSWQVAWTKAGFQSVPLFVPAAQKNILKTG